MATKNGLEHVSSYVSLDCKLALARSAQRERRSLASLVALILERAVAGPSAGPPARMVPLGAPSYDETAQHPEGYPTATGRTQAEEVAAFERAGVLPEEPTLVLEP